jgi:hypothetical protein
MEAILWDTEYFIVTSLLKYLGTKVGMWILSGTSQLPIFPNFRQHLVGIAYL